MCQQSLRRHRTQDVIELTQMWALLVRSAHLNWYTAWEVVGPGRCSLHPCVDKIDKAVATYLATSRSHATRDTISESVRRPSFRQCSFWSSSMKLLFGLEPCCSWCSSGTRPQRTISSKEMHIAWSARSRFERITRGLIFFSTSSGLASCDSDRH